MAISKDNIIDLLKELLMIVFEAQNSNQIERKNCIQWPQILKIYLSCLIALSKKGPELYEISLTSTINLIRSIENSYINMISLTHVNLSLLKI